MAKIFNIIVLVMIPTIILSEVVEYLYENSNYYKKEKELEEFRRLELISDREQAIVVMKEIEKKQEIERMKYFKQLDLELQEEFKKEGNYNKMILRNKNLKDYVCKNEGKLHKAYKDIGGTYTIGCGHTFIFRKSKKELDKIIIEKEYKYLLDKDIIRNGITEQELQYLLDKDINIALDDLKKLGIMKHWSKFDKRLQESIISYIFHTGRNTFKKEPVYNLLKSGNFSKTILAKKWLAGVKTHKMIMNVGGKNIMVSGIYSDGLKNRRQKEVNHFLG